MSITSVHEASAGSRAERRREARYAVTSPVYLDVGADNGGIVLNLSEQGIGFVPIFPLNGQTKLSLRVQFASSRPQIETTAQIAWFNETTQQAGVRFLSMPSEVRTQIDEWIGSEAALSAPIPPTSSQEPEASEPEPKHDGAQGSEALSLGLTREPGASDAIILGSPDVVREAAGSATDSLAEPSVTDLAEPDLVQSRLGELGKQDAAFSRSDLPDPKRQPDEPSQMDSSLPDLALTANGAYSDVALDWPIRASRDVSAVPPLTTAPAVQSAVSPSLVPDLNAEPAPAVVLPTSVFPEPIAVQHIKKWVWATALLALFSILCLWFGIGMWIRSHKRETTAAVVLSQPVKAEPAKSENAWPSTKRAASSVPKKAHAGLQARNGQTEREKTKPLPASPHGDEMPLPEISQPAPVQRSVGSASATLVENEPTVAPTPADSARTASDQSQRIVAGRPLKLTDRFNPCHLTYRVEPAYPQEAREHHIEGTVRIRQVIGADGSVRSVKLVVGSPLLAPAAMDAAKYWRYLPAMLNGEPVETEQEVEIEFRLPR